MGRQWRPVDFNEGIRRTAAPVYGRVFHGESGTLSPAVAYRTMEKQTIGRETMYCRLRVWWKRTKDSKLTQEFNRIIFCN